MKKTKFISLVLITAGLASCHHHKKKDQDWQSQQQVYMRSDESAPYSQNNMLLNTMLWYYAFRPYGYYSHGSYQRTGYYSGGISEHSNIGSSSFKASVVRGGFGGHGFSVSS